MSKPQLILFTGMAGKLRDALSEHFAIHPVANAEEAAQLPAAVRNNIEGVAVAGPDRLSADLLPMLPALRIISCYGVGYDGIDAEAAARTGIVVTHTPGVLNDEVANTTIALVLATTRRIVAYDRYVREGRWEREGAPPLTRGLAGKRAGMVGIGRIGQAIVEKLSVFDCEVVYHARNRREEVDLPYYDDLVAMASECDILIVITPGGSATKGLIDERVMNALGPEGTLINIARGSVVDEKAMVAALREGRLGGAGLDVFENEPHVPGELFDMDNVVLLPHVGSATVETRRAMADLAVRNLVVFFETGKAETPVPECQ